MYLTLVSSLKEREPVHVSFWCCFIRAIKNIIKVCIIKFWIYAS